MFSCARAVAAICCAAVALQGFGDSLHQRRVSRASHGYPRPELVMPDGAIDRSLDVAPPLRGLADGCFASSAFCNTISSGRLAPGDCTNDTDGTYLDVFRFSGTSGQYVTFTVRPQSATFTAPLAVLVPPVGDASKTPLISGGSGAATVSSVLTSTGSWSAGVGTSNLFSLGDYVAKTVCVADPAPSLPPGCVSQTLLCNQRASWYLTNQSCRFSGADSNYVYAEFDIYAVPGDVMTIDLISDFQGGFGVIKDNGTSYLLSSTYISNSHQQAFFSAPVVGFYAIIVTTVQPQQTGFFSLSVNCSSSGCIEPLIIQQPQDVNAVLGQRTTLHASANGTSPRFEWFDESIGLPVSVATGATFQTPPLARRSTYYYVASNACGEDTSAAVRVTPIPSRTRAVKH
jgi:hypothetical protein